MSVRISRTSGIRYVANSESVLWSPRCTLLGRAAAGRSFSANDLAEICGLPHEALAKILQQLATAGVLMSHREINGGYTLARDPRRISVFDVTKASEGPRRSGIRPEHSRHSKSIPGYRVLGKVSLVVEGMLRRLTLEDIEEEVHTPLVPLAR